MIVTSTALDFVLDRFRINEVKMCLSSDNGSVSSEDGPTYVLEHLATFRVSPESDLVYPADGMRRLLHMEKTSGIWTQKMTLRLDKKWVYIQSHENGVSVHCLCSVCLTLYMMCCPVHSCSEWNYKATKH